MTGTKEYFVVKNNSQGKWQSEVSVDLPPFIAYQVERNKPYRERYIKQREEEARKMVGELKKNSDAKRLGVEKKKADAQARTAQNDQVKAETQKRLMEKMLAQEKKTKSKTPVKEPTKPAGTATSPDQAFQTILTQHRDTTYTMLMHSAARGESTVSVAAIAAARENTMNRLNNTSSLLASINRAWYRTPDALKAKMSAAENEARQLCIQHHTKSASKK